MITPSKEENFFKKQSGINCPCFSIIKLNFERLFITSVRAAVKFKFFSIPMRQDAWSASGWSALLSQAERLLTVPIIEEIPSSSSPSLVTDATNCPDWLVVTLQNVKQNDCFRPIVRFLLSGCWLRSVSVRE